jgi:hypothetical protein
MRQRGAADAAERRLRVPSVWARVDAARAREGDAKAVSLHSSYTFWMVPPRLVWWWPSLDYHRFHCASTQSVHRQVWLEWYWRGRRRGVSVWLSRACRCRELGLR